MTKELNYSPLFQFVGKSAEVSLFFPNLHTTFDYQNFRADFRDEHLYLSDHTNEMIWTLIPYHNIKDIVYHEDSEVVDLMLKDGGFVAVCENNLSMGNFDIAEFE